MPTALARTGHLVRAAESAYTINDEFKQGTELLELVKAAASAGDLRGAQTLAESIPLRQLRDQALVALVPAWARAGERETAVALAERIRYPHNWGWAWALLAKEAADSGDIDEALRFAARAGDEVSSYPVDGTEHVLALLVEVAVTTGDHDRAAALADHLADFTRSRGATGWSQPRPLAKVLAREVLAGDFDRLDALLRPALRSGGTALEGDPGGDLEEDPEEDLDEVAARPFFRRSPLDAWDMACVLDAVAETADQDQDQDLALIPALADRAEALLETGVSRDHDILLRSVTLLLARHGQVERAMALADRLDPDLSVARHAEIVGELARSGDTGRAEALAHSINDPWAQGEALVAVARETARHGDPDRAETLTRSIAHRATRARALAALVEQPEQPEKSGPFRARRLAAQAVVLDGWAPVLPALERIAPRSVAVVADLMMGGSVAGDDILPSRTSPPPPRP
ncbi:hypothetical protein [Streptomyces sp. NPDC005538]|uniref:hypothetical protein n=1 Tax=unclassified Streptomyces TaxID=2593676 RepID=UPI0033AB2AAD